MIKFGDGVGKKMGEIYERMDCMIGEISDIMKNKKHQSDHRGMNDIQFSYPVSRRTLFYVTLDWSLPQK